MFRFIFLLVGLVLAVSAAAEERGADLFKNTCAACHGEGGPGIPGLAPPLAGALGAHLASPKAASYFSQIVVSGLSGQIRVGQQIFNGAMPPFGALPNEELVEILMYVTTRLNDAPPGFGITGADIEQARQKHASGSETHALRNVLLNGVKQ